jgi:hypothetical protein
MARPYSPRRWFTSLDIERMRQLAAAGQSQADAARALNRDPGTIAGAATRYRIQFAAGKGGTPVRADPEKSRAKRAENCRRYRARKGAKTRTPKITRFDDPRVMHQIP